MAVKQTLAAGGRMAAADVKMTKAEEMMADLLAICTGIGISSVDVFVPVEGRSRLGRAVAIVQ